MLRGLKQRFPQVHLKAFTMVEVGYLAQRSKISIRETIERLKDAGMDSMPGGGAEIFPERVRRIICDHKMSGNEWLEVARTAHQMGLQSNCTMLYGHIETEEDRVDHLVRLRALQDDTDGYQTFIPLAFHPDNTPLRHIAKTTGFTDFREDRGFPADARQHSSHQGLLDDDDAADRADRAALRRRRFDGTVVEEDYHDAGATTSQGLRRGELLRLIREAGREPVERDTLYRPVDAHAKRRSPYLYRPS